jgi:hypothetical protein
MCVSDANENAKQVALTPKTRFVRVMQIFSFHILSLHAIGIALFAKLYDAYASSVDGVLRDAFMTCAIMLVVSALFRVVAAIVWSTTKQYEKFEGKVVLLCVSVVSTYMAALLVGGVMMQSSVIDEYKHLDPNIRMASVLPVILLCSTVAELYYSHVQPAGSRPPKKRVQDLMVALIMCILVFMFMMSSLATRALSIYILGRLIDDTNAAVSPAGKMVHKAVESLFLLCWVSAGCTIVMVISYLTKMGARCVDTGIFGQTVFLTAAVSSWLASTFAYGATLPTLGILNVYRRIAANEPELDNSTFVSTNNLLLLIATGFSLDFMAIVLIHLVAFLRSTP